MLKIGNKVLNINDKWLKGPDTYNPLGLPPYTIRLKYYMYHDEYDDWIRVEPVLPNGGTKTLVDSENNIWDVTKESYDWSGLLENYNTDLMEVLGANTTGVTYMSRMFKNCRDRLTSVPLFDTRNVTNMSHMFEGCVNLTSVALFNTRNVTDMSYMFSKYVTYAMNIETVPLFDTRNVTNMSHMFEGCRIKNVPLFNTHNVTNMSYMFNMCSSPGGLGDARLETVPLFDTSNVNDMSYMLALQAYVQNGALALYQQASTQATPPSNHSGTFTDCGSMTQTGAAELAQIPRDWK